MTEILNLVDRLKTNANITDYKYLAVELINLSIEIGKVKLANNQIKFDYDNLRNKRLLDLKADKAIKLTIPELDAILDNEFTEQRRQLMIYRGELDDTQLLYSSVVLFIDTIKTEIIDRSKQVNETFTI